MVYDEELDETVFSESVEVGEFRLSVEVHQYNGNEPRIQLGRQKKDRHLKLGRLSLGEINAILPLVEKAKDKLVEGVKVEESKEPEKTSEEPQEGIKSRKKTKKDKPKEKAQEGETKEKEEATQEKMEKGLPEFELVISEPYLLKEPINNIKELINEAKIKVSKDRLSLVEMDPANVSMSIFELLSSAFVEWDAKEEFIMGINLNNFAQILRNAKKEDIVVLKRNEAFKLGIEMKGNTTRKFEIPVIELDEKEQKIPELKHDVKVRMPTKDLKEQIKGADEVAEAVTFKVERGKFTVSAKGDLAKFNTENKEGEHVEIDAKKDSVARYSVEYIKKMTNAVKISDEVVLEFSTDYPLKMSFVQVDRLKLVHILAPRVADE